MWVPWIWTQDLMLAQNELYSMSDLPSPHHPLNKINGNVMAFLFEMGSGWPQIYYASDFFWSSCNVLKHDTEVKMNGFYIRWRQMNEHNLCQTVRKPATLFKSYGGPGRHSWVWSTDQYLWGERGCICLQETNASKCQAIGKWES